MDIASKSQSVGRTWAVDDGFVLPDYRGACVSNIVPAVLEHAALGHGWLDPAVTDADQVVLVVIDGLGWNQLVARAEHAPVLSAGGATAITTVAPSTTAAALTSISTGVPPGEHGVIGYRIRVGAETLNTLRWGTSSGDARERILPREFQPVAPFGGRAPVVVNKAEFIGSGFTTAHLDGVDYRPYSNLSTMVWEIGQAVAQGARFTYAYYDGLDRIGHERGHGGEFDAELAFVDRLVGDIRNSVPDDTVVVVTADHGQVDTTGTARPIASAVMKLAKAVSGEDRFVWLHSDDPHELARVANDLYGADFAVCTADEIIDAMVLGPHMSSDATRRLGDVALLARGSGALLDPQRSAPMLRGRHGSLTRDEMLVPLVVL